MGRSTTNKNLFMDDLNPYLLNGLGHFYHLDESISNFRGVWCTLSFVSYS